MKESLTWKCEQVGEYRLCNCFKNAPTTTAQPIGSLISIYFKIWKS